jgi:GNAT superfamily N-acetyltransferase
VTTLADLDRCSHKLTIALVAGQDVPVQGQEAIDEVMLRPRNAFSPFPGVYCISRPNWHQIITPALKEGGLNGISLAVLEEADAERGIDEGIRPYEELGLRFRWTVGPESRPRDLGARLEARGLKAVHTRGMLGSYGGPYEPSEIAVELVDTETLAEFNDVMARGWGMKMSFMDELNAHVLRESPERNPFFIARIAGQAIGGGSYFRFPKSAFLVGAVVLPEFRHRGVYRALVRARQEHAHKAGVQVATTHAMAETSAPVLAKLGFRSVCDFVSYVNR